MQNKFSAETFSFLSELDQNNSKPWFESNRRRYEKFVLTPFKELVDELAEFMLTIDSEFEVRPAVNKTISRIYRDVRFSKDKRPFRSNMWLTFKNPLHKIGDCAGFYFSVHPEGFSYGFGFYSAKPDQMKKFRGKIISKPESFRQAIEPVQKNGTFTLKPEFYKRPPEKDTVEGLEEWFKMKTFYYFKKGDSNTLLSIKDLPDQVTNDFISLAPLYRFLRDIF